MRKKTALCSLFYGTLTQSPNCLKRFLITLADVPSSPARRPAFQTLIALCCSRQSVKRLHADLHCKTECSLRSTSGGNSFLRYQILVGSNQTFWLQSISQIRRSGRAVQSRPSAAAIHQIPNILWKGGMIPFSRLGMSTQRRPWKCQKSQGSKEEQVKPFMCSWFTSRPGKT